MDEALLHDVVHRQQLDGSHAERRQVRDRAVRCEARIGAAQVLAHVGVQLREALHVQLVDGGLVPGSLESPVALPVERRVDHDAARHRGRVIRVVGHGLGSGLTGAVRQRVRRLPAHAAVDRLRVGIEQELGRVEEVPALGRPRPVDTQAVALPGPDVRQVAVPVEGRPLRQLVALLAALGVEQAELDALRVLREEREVGALPVPRRAQRERPARPDHAVGCLSVANRAESTGPRVRARARPAAAPAARPTTAGRATRAPRRRPPRCCRRPSRRRRSRPC